MDPRYYRPPSPGSRRLHHSERASTGTLGYDSYGNSYSRPSRDIYAQPRSSNEGVIPISTETYVNGVKTSSSRLDSAYDSYSNPLRHSSVSEQARRPSHYVSDNIPSRSRAAVIQTSVGGHTSPLALSPTRYDKDYYVQPATTPHKRAQKKVYSIDDGKSARLIDYADQAVQRRESVDASSNPRHAVGERRRDYHRSGPKPRAYDASYDAGYEYTDARGMYRDTEPVRRQRRGSVDGRRERPSSVIESYPTRPSKRDTGPPVTTRGLDKLNGGLGRSGSLRDSVRSSARERTEEYGWPRDDDTYDHHRRSSTNKHLAAVSRDRDSGYGSHRDDYDDSSEPRRHARGYDDPDVASRGFGIRSGSPERLGQKDDSIDRRGSYAVDPFAKDTRVRDYPRELPREETVREVDRSERPRASDRDRDVERQRERDLAKGYEMEPRRERDRERDREYALDADYRDKHRADRAAPEEGPNLPSGAIPTAMAATAAYGAQEAVDRRKRDQADEYDTRTDRPRRADSQDSEVPRRRHYVGSDDIRVKEQAGSEQHREDVGALDPEEEYRRRVQRELGRWRKDVSSVDDVIGTERQEDSGRAVMERYSDAREDDSQSSRALVRRVEEDNLSDGGHDRSGRQHSILEGPLIGEPGLMSDRRENRVRIVTPPNEKTTPPPPKGILRKPTEKFPEHPDSVREGVAPLKDATKKGIPPNARWTKIDRRMVNPEALEEAKERFEERMDCVIVLRVLTKEEIQRLAERTKELREDRAYADAAKDKQKRKDRERDREKDERRRERRKEDRDHRRYDGVDDDSGDSEAEEGRQPRQRMIENGTPGELPLEKASFVRNGSVAQGQGLQGRGEEYSVPGAYGK